MGLKFKFDHAQGRRKSQAHSLAALASWPLKFGLAGATRRYRQLIEFKPEAFDKFYYQVEVHDLDDLHPIIHYLDRGEALGFRPLPPRPRSPVKAIQLVSDPASRLISALTFRPPTQIRTALPLGQRVDVIMPCFNRCNSVGQAIRSVLGQTHGDQRVIVVDDGSIDGSAAYIASEFETEILSGEVCLIESTHDGVSAARNVGLSYVTADWVAYLDSDNQWVPDHLARHFDAVHDESCGWSYGALITKVERLDCHENSYDRFELLQHNWIDLNTLVHRSDWIDQIGGFDTRLRRLVDYDFALRLGRLGPPAHVKVATVHYKVSENSISAKEDFLNARARIRLSHICERISWGLVKPKLYLEPGLLTESTNFLQAENLVEIVRRLDEADLHATIGGADQMGRPSIMIYEKSMTSSEASKGKLATIIGTLKCDELSRSDMLADLTYSFDISAKQLNDLS